MTPTTNEEHMTHTMKAIKYALETVAETPNKGGFRDQTWIHQISQTNVAASELTVFIYETVVYDCEHDRLPGIVVMVMGKAVRSARWYLGAQEEDILDHMNVWFTLVLDPS